MPVANDVYSVGALAAAAASWLRLAAAPSFAVMALGSGFADSGTVIPLCSVESHSAALGSMAAMYGLMSVFAMVPWLNLIVARRRL
jgi:hypothetical protein